MPIAADIRGMNPLFLVLSALSAVPTAFFLLMFVTGAQASFEAVLFLWCALWTWVWYKMADRYR